MSDNYRNSSFIFSSDKTSLRLSRSPYGPHSRLGHTCRVWKYDYHVSRHDTSHDEYYLNLFVCEKHPPFLYLLLPHLRFFDCLLVSKNHLLHLPQQMQNCLKQ